jgi:hypothetical protein
MISSAKIQAHLQALAQHFTANINNRFIRKALLSLELERGDWDRIERLVHEGSTGNAQLPSFEEVYEAILAFGRFIKECRQLDVRGIGTVAGESAMDKTLREMAVSNFRSNLGVLADQVNEFYVLVAEEDKEVAKGRAPVYRRIPELSELGRMLTS